MNINVYNLENCLFSNVVYLQKCVHFKMQGNKEEWSELNIFLTGLMSQLWAMKSQELPTIVVLNGMYCSTGSCPLLGLCPRFDVLFSHNFYLNCVNLRMPFSTTCTFKLCLVKFLPQFYLHWLICFIKYNMQYTLLIQ